MHFTTIFTLGSLAATGLSFPTPDEAKMNAAPLALRFEDYNGYERRQSSKSDAPGISPRGLLRRANTPVSNIHCPDETRAGITYTFLSSECSSSAEGSPDLAAYQCLMAATNGPADEPIRSVWAYGSCAANQVCEDGKAFDFSPNEDQAWCVTKGGSSLVSIASTSAGAGAAGSVVTGYQGGAAGGNTAATVVVATDAALTSGIAIDKITIQPEKISGNLAGPIGSPVTCLNTDRCTFYNIPDGTAQFMNTFFDSNNMNVYMAIGVTGSSG